MSYIVTMPLTGYTRDTLRCVHVAPSNRNRRIKGHYYHAIAEPTIDLASCPWLVQEIPNYDLASGHLLTFGKDVLTRLLIETDNSYDRLEH